MRFAMQVPERAARPPIQALQGLSRDLPLGGISSSTPKIIRLRAATFRKGMLQMLTSPLSLRQIISRAKFPVLCAQL